MKKTLFIIFSMLLGIDAFAASGLVRKSVDTKVPVLFGRAGSLKASHVSKKSGNTSIIQDIANANTSRMSKLIRQKSSVSGVGNTGTIISGKDGITPDPVILLIKDKKLWWGYDNGSLLDNTSMFKELIDFTKLYEANKSTIIVKPEFRCIDGKFEYKVAVDDEWEVIKGANCEVNQSGKNGNNLSLRCNPNEKEFEITTDDPNSADAEWTLMHGANCIAQDGQDFNNIIKWSCDTNTNKLYYAFECAENDECNGNTDWIELKGSKCQSNMNNENPTVAANIECIDGLLYANHSNTWIRCETSGGQDYINNTNSAYDRSCVDGKLKIKGELSDLPCNFGYCHDDGFYHYEVNKQDIKTNVSCRDDEELEYFRPFCYWGTNTVFLGGTDTRVSCNNFVFGCNDLGLLTLNGQLVYYEGEAAALGCDFMFSYLYDDSMLGCNKETGNLAVSRCDNIEEDIFDVIVCKDGDPSCLSKQKQAVGSKLTLFRRVCKVYEKGIPCRDWYVYCDKSTSVSGKYDCVSSKTNKPYRANMVGLSYGECVKMCEPDPNDKFDVPSWYPIIDENFLSLEPNIDDIHGIDITNNASDFGMPVYKNEKSQKSVAIH